jgi:hypothetical protein
MNKKFNKTIVMGLIILFVGASVTINLSANENNELNNPVNMPPNWYETFDIYEDGQFLDGTPDDGGWEGWDGNSTVGAYVTSDVYLTPPHSVEIAVATDLIHQFEGYNSGVWNFSAWVYVPSDYEGSQGYMILSVYYHEGGEDLRWNSWIQIDSFTGTVVAMNDGWELPMIWDDWAQFLAIIDLDSDWYEMYYNGEILEYKEWTAGWDNSYNCELEIKCLDLYAAGGSAVYYDDLAFRAFGSPPEPDLSAAGSINFANVTAGSTNTGSFSLTCLGAAGSTLNWEIESFPDWGTWTITPDSGTTNYGDRVDVEVSVVAPDEQESAFTGEIKVVNTENSDDFAIIPCSLTTPKFKQSFIQQFIERFPNLRNIFRL